jgi:hypothetical protein
MLSPSIAITKHLPMSLATHKVAERFKKTKRDGASDSELDLFSHDRSCHYPFLMIFVIQGK